MDFDFSEDQRLLQRECRRMLEGQCTLARVREIFEGEAAYDRDLWISMGELGWLGAAIPQKYGGSGMSQLDLAVIAEEVGRAIAAVPFSSSVYMASAAILLAGSEDQKQKYLPALASGELIGCFAIQESIYNRNTIQFSTALNDGKLTGAKTPVLDGDIADIAIVTCMDGDRLMLTIVDLHQDGVSRRSIKALDQSRSQAHLTFHSAKAERLEHSAGAAETLSSILDRAAVLIAFEQIGGGERCLELARDFALQRQAFGRSIASFQAIKHKLADIYVSLELARSNAYYGIWALENNADVLGIAASVARISATEAFDGAAEEALHVHGGMGFTWQVDSHLFVRRAKLLSSVVGSARSWKSKLIDRMQGVTVA